MFFVRELDNGAANGHILNLIAVGNFLWCASDRCVTIWNPSAGIRVGAQIPKGASTLTLVPTGNTSVVWTNSLDRNEIQLYDGTVKLVNDLHQTTSHLGSIPTPPEGVLSLVHVQGKIWGGGLGGSIFVWDAQVTFTLPFTFRLKNW